ncbi:MAG: TIGR04066 family peptide maturation system protein [Oscillospiraceae bacterium]|nr:TIGR04066 family peptide maturation system protein [Oscillospiraceae bacterium]
MNSALMIFPFAAEHAAIVRYANLSAYSVRGAISPKAWGLCGQDAGFCDNGNITGVIISDDFNKALNQCDTVFMDFISEKITPGVYFDRINESLSQNKTIIITQNLEEYLGIPEDKYLNIKVIGQKQAGYSNYINNSLCVINTPIIFVAGIGENCNKFDIQLALRAYFQNKGYNILQFGSRAYSELFGFSQLPGFLYERLSFSDKALMFNQYVSKREKEQNPDLIIVGIPGGYSYMTKKRPNGFGEIALCISAALDADVCILSIYKSYGRQSDLKEIMAKASNKLNCRVEFIHEANKRLLYDPANIEEIGFLTVHTQRNNLDRRVFSVFDNISTLYVFDEIYNLLAAS